MNSLGTRANTCVFHAAIRKTKRRHYFVINERKLTFRKREYVAPVGTSVVDHLEEDAFRLFDDFTFKTVRWRRFLIYGSRPNFGSRIILSESF